MHRSTAELEIEEEAAPGRRSTHLTTDPKLASLPVRPGTLAARALKGDRAAWDELIRRHNTRVMVSLLARKHRLDEAKELAQETWMRLIDQARRGRLLDLSLPGLAIVQARLLASERHRR